MKKLIVYCAMLFLLALVMPDVASAASGHMKLLAVSDSNNVFYGSIADLFLEIKPGTGHIFIDSFPLSKLDTQISTRFAKEIACDSLNIDCSVYDFFFIIRAKTSVIGGPSAGSALTVLTATLLEKKIVNESVAITGTINSGGFIGPVSGIKEKIEAAKKDNVTLVLIPIGSSLIDSATNKTFTVRELSKNLSISIKEVAHLSEALPYFADFKKEEMQDNLEIDKSYSDIMNTLAEMLCNRTEKWKLKVNFSGNFSLPILEMQNKSNIAFGQGYYYASASYCFSANVNLAREFFNSSISGEQVLESIKKLETESKILKEKMPGYDTLNDLEAYTAVMERISESEDNLFDARMAFFDNKTSDAINLIAYANERLYSAFSWSKFFNTGNKEEIKINKAELDECCLSKLSEAQERIDYLKIYFTEDFLENIMKDFKKADAYSSSNQTIMCIFEASKLKARADVILNALSLKNDSVKSVIEKRLEFIKQNIILENEKNHFPILGYSYYEYAKSLLNDDPGSAMLYAEYALELGNLDMYFPPIKRKVFFFDYIILGYVSTGLGIGFILGFTVTRIYMVKKTEEKKAFKKKRSFKTRLDGRATKSGKKR